MTRERLKAVYIINKEIEMWEKELDDIREESLMKSKEITGMPFSNTNKTSDPIAELATKIVDIEMIILGRKKELELERINILKYINDIEDPFIRVIVKYRCADCKKWEDIAQILGYERTTCSKKFKEFLKKLPEK